MNTSNFHCGGPVSDLGCYITRQADREVVSHLRQGEYLHISGPRQQGKTSLLLQLPAAFSNTTVGLVYLDLAELDDRSESNWYEGLFRHISIQWKAISAPGFPMMPTVSAGYAGWDDWLHQVETLLKDSECRLVIALDEVRLPRFPESDLFFYRIRSHTTCPSRRVTFLLAGVFAHSELIQGYKKSPFNVGRPVRLADFSLGEVKDLMLRGGLGPTSAERLAGAVYGWTGGHPFLTQCLCAELSPGCEEPDEVDRAAHHVRSQRVAHFDDIQRRLRPDSQLWDVAGRLLQDNGVPCETVDPTTQSELELLGIIKEVDNRWHIRNRFYQELLRSVIHGRSSKTGAGKPIFISYAREDGGAMTSIVEHLKAEWLQDGLVPWADPLLRPGQEYRKELEAVIRESVAAILLVSVHFMLSEFIRDVELPLIRERHAREKMPVFPFILSPSSGDRDPWIKGLPWHPPGDNAFNELKGKARKARALQAFARELSRCLTSCDPEE